MELLPSRKSYKTTLSAVMQTVSNSHQKKISSCSHRITPCNCARVNEDILELWNWFQSCYSRLIDCDQKSDCGMAEIKFYWISITFSGLHRRTYIKSEKLATERWSRSLSLSFNIETYYRVGKAELLCGLCKSIIGPISLDCPAQRSEWLHMYKYDTF